MRAKGVSIGGSANWLNNFAVGISTSPFVAASSFGTFIFFGVMCILAIVWIWFFLPETKGRTLEEMFVSFFFFLLLLASCTLTYIPFSYPPTYTSILFPAEKEQKEEDEKAESPISPTQSLTAPLRRDELFGEAGFAQADLTLKQRIEREIGLTALLYGDEFAKTLSSSEEKPFAEKSSGEGQQKESVREYVERSG